VYTQGARGQRAGLDALLHPLRRDEEALAEGVAGGEAVQGQEGAFDAGGMVVREHGSEATSP
jgi:hypothetical protein